MDIPKLLALKDIQIRWQMTRQAVHKRKKNDPDFPAPVMTVADGSIPLFLESDIAEYESQKPWVADPGLRGARTKWMFTKFIADRQTGRGGSH